MSPEGQVSHGVPASDLCSDTKEGPQSCVLPWHLLKGSSHVYSREQTVQDLSSALLEERFVSQLKGRHVILSLNVVQTSTPQTESIDLQYITLQKLPNPTETRLEVRIAVFWEELHRLFWIVRLSRFEQRHSERFDIVRFSLDRNQGSL